MDGGECPLHGKWEKGVFRLELEQREVFMLLEGDLQFGQRVGRKEFSGCGKREEDTSILLRPPSLSADTPLALYVRGEKPSSRGK